MENKETYTEYKERTQAELNAFPMAFAFNQEQFAKGMVKLGLTVDDTDKVCSVPGGGFILKTDSAKLCEMFVRHRNEFKRAIDSDSAGSGFIYQAFNYELANHEYCITYDVTDTLAALGLTMDEVNSNPAMVEGLKAAVIRNS